ncbi:MAG: HEAT repeat domain-containing protein [Nitrospirae bacterium]|nr:HEAT repeat domain-containing protein [Nitrospirota bacterium]
MADDREILPLDAQLLSEAIFELNVSRRNVNIYPAGHPSVERSLNKAFDSLERLFELRAEITFAVAKDTIIIEDSVLDKKNTAYREFALHLSGMNIAYVTFRAGLTKDELYKFLSFLSVDTKELSPEELQEVLEGYSLIHIRAGFIDYDAFSFGEGMTERGDGSSAGSGGAGLWERYVRGLLDGTLQTDGADVIQEIPPEALAEMLNTTDPREIKEAGCERVINTYMKQSAKKTFSSRELTRLIDFISKLRPELKRQFLSSAIKNVSTDIRSTERALKEISVDKIIELLSAIDEQQVTIPAALKNLLDKFSKFYQLGSEDTTFGDSIIADDIFLSPDVVTLLGQGDFESYVTDVYQKEIERVLRFDVSDVASNELAELRKACSDEHVERYFNQTMLELISSDIIEEDEYEYIINIIKDEAVQFIETGQYGQVLKIFRVLEANISKDRFPDISSEALKYYKSPEFIAQFIESLRIIGRQAREDAQQLCDYYGERIISPLMEALVVEESQTIRHFLISLITHFGEKAIPAAIKHISDSRWFVKRNMLHILNECGTKEVLPHVRPYCHHENHKVSFEAIKCLLKEGDAYGINALRGYLRSENRELVEQAIALTGIYKVKELVPELIQMLKRKGISGKDIHEKIPIVRALGQIGDPSALDAVRKALSIKSILFKSAVERLREAIYRSLKYYPFEHVQDLVEKGLKSKNERIRHESMKIKESRRN